MPDEKKGLTEEQAKVYEILFNMGIKFLLVLAGLVAFFIVLYVTIKEKDNVSKSIYALLDTMLGFTTYKIYNHYFPTPPAKPAAAKKSPKNVS